VGIGFGHLGGTAHAITSSHYDVNGDGRLKDAGTVSGQRELLVNSNDEFGGIAVLRYAILDVCRINHM